MTSTSTSTTTDHRTDFGCPEWCIRDDHWADEVGPGQPATHYAADRGSVGVQSDLTTSEAIVYLGGEAAYCADPAELRRVAADMLDAADWLDQHRQDATPATACADCGATTDLRYVRLLTAPDVHLCSDPAVCRERRAARRMGMLR